MAAPAPRSTADLCDEFGDRLESCSLPLRQYGGERAFGGPIVTFRSPEDNLILKQIITEPGEGRVIVVDVHGSTRVAMIGDSMAETAAANGWSGFVINGAVRDVGRLAELPIGVKALGSNPRRSVKSGNGERDVTVSFGGAVFRPGAVLASDDDGIVVLPAADVSAIPNS
ncbi:ribonuclease E activity regulator RraA [Nocardioides humi]|uniref:4-hydroxy-4-methyl-2-oxoglutarate aldolase n=1 Tax=Nocardioides humi TaxID=449461 RepID=A0ABN2A8F9_9ACTN|nr:ribonuclease E activity regulator RraA [Nocardioides humi]